MAQIKEVSIKSSPAPMDAERYDTLQQAIDAALPCDHLHELKPGTMGESNCYYVCDCPDCS